MRAMSITKYLRINAMIVLIMALNCNARAQNIVAAEYFFNTDPGPGNGTPISITAGTTITVNNLNIPSTSLSTGWHTLCVRTKDSNNVWGFYECRNIFIRSTPPDPPPLAPITAMEYFYDNVNDPGTGQTVAITSGTNVTVSAINLPQSLAQGWHTLHVRTQDQNNVWGFYETRSVYVRSTPVVPPLPAPITAMEYYYDNVNDPDTGLPVTITTGTNVNVSGINLPQTLAQGWHTLHVRTKDQNSVWGFYETRSVYVRSTPVVPPLPAPITAMEYYYDNVNDPGTGLPVTITTGTNVNVSGINLPQSLAQGWHTLHVRSQDQNSMWGFYETRSVFVRSQPVVAPLPPNIVQFEYFVDTDPGVGLSVLTLTKPPSTLIDLPAEPLNIGSLSLGSHILGLRAKDQNGTWSTTEQRSFTIVSGCTAITAPTATNATRCTPGTLTLTANGAIGSQTYRWYADNTTLVITSTGSPFTTPSLSANTDYYVSIYDPTTFCESSRTKASAIVTGIPKPTLNLTGSLTVCQGNMVVLQAPVGFSSYTWSNGLTTPQITVATSGSYTVTVGNGTCFSPSSDPFTFTVNPNPAKPTVNATGGGSLCGTGSVTLSAPVGFPTYSWSSGQSTQSIIVNAIGNFTVTVTDANSCQSIPSDVFTVTSSAIAKPLIGVTGNTALCNSSMVDLAAPSGFGSYAWSNGATTQNITVSTAGSYTVVVSNGGCTSPASDAVPVTTVTVPAKPVITVTGTTALCNGAFVVLSAPTGFSNYVWSNGELTRQIVVAVAGTFTVQVGNASTCLSVASDPSVITLTGAACGGVNPPSITNASRCGNGTVTLNASGATGSQVYRWYDAPTAGIVLFTGAAFTTPSLTTTTNYYPAIYDPSVTAESIRVIATATVVNLAKPVTDVTGTIFICTGGNTTISAPVGFANYLWSNGAVKQQLTVSTSGNYSVQVGDGTCTSPASNPVIVTEVVIPAKPSIAVTGNLALCNGAFVGLSAPTGFTSYVWSNGETTRQIVANAAGSYTVQVGHASNCLSVSSDPVAVTQTGLNCVVSTASPTSTSASRCGQGTVTLTASGATGAQEYRWYDLATAGTLLFTGSAYTTPAISITTSYYVSIFDPSTGESNRVISTATVVNLTKPVTDVTGSIAICAGSSTLISAPAGFVLYKWSDGSVKQQLQVTAAGNYSVQTGDGTCLSAPSEAVAVSIETPPTKPIITTSGSATLCGGSVTLTGPVGSSVYVWSTGETTQTITVTQAGSYTLTVSNASGCGSATSNPFVVAGSIAKPIVSMVGSNKFCEGQTATLVGPVGFSAYKWSSGETTQQLTVRAAGSYSLQVTNADGCTSVASDAIVITVDAKPVKPAIVASGAVTFCAGQEVTLKGPDGFSYIWSNGATTQSIKVDETGSYSLLVRNSNSCLSAVSDPLLVTVNICSTNPPVIEDKVVRTSVQNRITESLIEYFSDKDNDVDLSSIEIVKSPASGALALIDANHNLVLDYSGLLFAGDETITVKICDLANNCTTGDLVIRVSGEVIVYNAISPNGDGLNETLYLEYIDLLTETKNNRVRIFNRWGDVVYEAENYNNTSIAFIGLGKNGEVLPPGTYFYRMDFSSGIPFKTGYFSLRR